MEMIKKIQLHVAERMEKNVESVQFHVIKRLEKIVENGQLHIIERLEMRPGTARRRRKRAVLQEDTKYTKQEVG
jgi:hypothetical protein